MKKKIKDSVVEESCCCEDNVFKKIIDKKKSAHLIFLTVVLVLLGWGYYRYWNVATVNGKAISRIDYIKTMERQGGKQILDQMVQETLIKDEAKKKEVTIQQSAIDDEIKRIESQVSAMGRTLEEALKSEGITREELEDQIRMQKMVEVLAGANVEITQEQIEKYLVDNKDQFEKGTSKEEMQSMAKEELASQASSKAISGWLEELNKNAKVVYK